jgi:hypothetical protein
VVGHEAAQTRRHGLHRLMMARVMAVMGRGPVAVMAPRAVLRRRVMVAAMRLVVLRRRRLRLHRCRGGRCSRGGIPGYPASAALVGRRALTGCPLTPSLGRRLEPAQPRRSRTLPGPRAPLFAQGPLLGQWFSLSEKARQAKSRTHRCGATNRDSTARGPTRSTVRTPDDATRLGAKRRRQSIASVSRHRGGAARNRTTVAANRRGPWTA